jgi:hypothetical protein
MATVEEHECGELQHMSGYFYNADYSKVNDRVRAHVCAQIREVILKHDLANCHSIHFPYCMKLGNRSYFSGKEIDLLLDRPILEQTSAILKEKGIRRSFCLFQSPPASKNGWTVAFVQN